MSEEINLFSLKGHARNTLVVRQLECEARLHAIEHKLATLKIAEALSPGGDNNE